MNLNKINQQNNIKLKPILKLEKFENKKLNTNQLKSKYFKFLNCEKKKKNYIEIINSNINNLTKFEKISNEFKLKPSYWNYNFNHIEINWKKRLPLKIPKIKMNDLIPYKNKNSNKKYKKNNSISIININKIQNSTLENDKEFNELIKNKNIIKDRNFKYFEDKWNIEYRKMYNNIKNKKFLNFENSLNYKFINSNKPFMKEDFCIEKNINFNKESINENLIKQMN